MPLFFTPHINSELLELPESEAHHAHSVLRMRVGERCTVTDGRGLMCQGEIAEISSKMCLVSIVERQENYRKWPYTIHIAVAPTKNIDRYEWFLEKATEIGVDHVTPLLCAHSERKVVKKERSEKVVMSAVKQSVKAYIPQVDELTAFDDFLATLSEGGQRFIAHCDEIVERRKELKHILQPAGDYIILIGPEGDFSPEEVKQANAAGFVSVTLGQQRLRTETAALYGVAVAAIKN